MASYQEFAAFGSEKMFYDVRMAPQAIRLGNRLIFCYQANPTEIYADPYLVEYDLKSGQWSVPVRVGQVDRSGFDHHLAPILWADSQEYIHLLYNCHGDCGIHLVSHRPGDIRSFVPCEKIAESISYPHAIRRTDGSVVLYYRAFGHMGNWNYTISRDGGYQWTKPVMVVDFDQDPESDADCWAGSYHSVQLGPDGRTLHIAFTYFDERGIWKQVHPVYRRKTSVNSRYNIYYMTIDLETGVARNFQGDALPLPLNRRKADQLCRILDTGYHLTMMPTMAFEENNSPGFLMPITEEEEFLCGYYYLRRSRGRWERTFICPTNHTWSGSRLIRRSPRHLDAYLIVGRTDGSRYTYGAGELERWTSLDNGETWAKAESLVPVKGLLYNNPITVETAENSSVLEPGLVAFYGWEGPHSIQPVIDRETDIPTVHRGRAFLLWEEPALAQKTSREEL